MGWGRFNPMNRFRKAATAREVAAVRATEVDEAASAQFEQQEAADETVAEADAEAFKAGLLEEDELIRELGRLHASKYRLLKVLQLGKATWVRLSMAKRTVLNKLAIGGKRIAMAYGRLGKYGPGAGYNPDNQRNMELWLQEQQREVFLLQNELAQQVKELQEEAASVGPVIQKNKAIRDVLKKYELILTNEDRRLLDIANKKFAEIVLARDELRADRDALQKERDALRQQRGAAVRR